MMIGSKKAPIRDLIHWCKTADPKPHRLLLRRAAGPYISEQTGDLRPAVQGRRQDDDHDRRRPKTSRRTNRPHRCAAHMGLGNDPPPPRAHDRARRRPVKGPIALGALPASLLPARACALAPLPPPLFADADRGA